DSTVEHLEDCQRMKIEVVPPDVNRSEAEFAVTDGNIFFSLAALKGCGTSAAEAVAAARRAGGPFRSLFDFCERVDPGTVNRSAIETLIKAGAFDSLGARRAQLFGAIDRALQSGASKAADRRSGQRGLFDDQEEGEEESPTANLPNVPEWDERDKLVKEKEVLGFYLSSHPLAEHRETLSTYCTHTTTKAAALRHGAEVMLGGMLSAIKFSHTKNPRPGSPTRYAMFDLEDMEGTIRSILWPDQFVQYGELVQPDAILAVPGTIDKRGGSDEANLIVGELLPLEDVKSRFTRGVRIRVAEETHGQKGLEKLYEILRGYPGNCELELVVFLADGTRVPMSCERLRVNVNPEMRSRIEALLGPGNLQLVPTPHRTAAARGNGRSRGR
ncbi:MAG: OB-fold nucleic acid binding domain-containing protein, partial [Planctomycetota bacterium]